MAVDGSTLQLPGNHRSLKEKFSYHRFGPQAAVGHWMSRVSYLYDVFNGLVLDAQMEGYNKSETRLCKQHMPFVKKGDLVLFDRYYACYELMFLLQAKGAHFVFRMKENWWTVVKTFAKSDLKEQLVSFRLPAKLSYLKAKYPHLKEVIQVRLIKKVNRKGEIQVFCTSLTDGKTYSRKAIINLYRQRWGIEEAYKLIKARLEVADFSGQTAWAIQQDFYAKTLLISLVNSLCAGIDPKKTTRCKLPKRQEQPDKPRTRIINRTYAIYQLKDIIRKMATSWLDWEQWLGRFCRRVKEKVEYSRKNHTYPRENKPICKHTMAYKAV